jgi:hypothetical protein
MTSRPPVWLLVGGLCVIFLGFIYHTSFAGIPYQDPTLAMHKNWEFHDKVGMRIILFGAVVFSAGCFLLCLGCTCKFINFIKR